MPAPRVVSASGRKARTRKLLTGTFSICNHRVIRETSYQYFDLGKDIPEALGDHVIELYLVIL